MIENKFYLKGEENLKHAMFLTDLTKEEIKTVVGKIRAEVVSYDSGVVVIRDVKTKKVLWRT